jgi:hypothetical protein
MKSLKYLAIAVLLGVVSGCGGGGPKINDDYLHAVKPPRPGDGVRLKTPLDGANLSNKYKVDPSKFKVRPPKYKEKVPKIPHYQEPQVPNIPDINDMVNDYKDSLYP